jgi:D-alanyl-D-alanine carboxypeptidase
VIAEALGGSEGDFARLMTRKARALGMSRTLYKNASGLPDDEQVTTARDQALLGLAIQERFPRYYRYFSTPAFVFHGRKIRNHNNLLGRVDGIDGIKTGYTRASGFNLLTSLHRGNRYLLAVVLGGPTSAQRDARMRDLLAQYIVTASTKPAAAKVAGAALPRLADVPLPTPRAEIVSLADTPSADTTATVSKILPGSTDPIIPLLVKTFAVRPGTMRIASNAQADAPVPETLTQPST